MKKFSIIMMFVAAVAFTSCSTLSSVTATTAGTDGSNCAKALVGLYNSKKATGTVSITNTTDLSNMLVLINSYNQLRSHKDDATYKTQFTTGMVNGGSGLITTANATSIMTKLLNSTGLSNVNAANIASKAETVAAILTLLNAMK